MKIKKDELKRYLLTASYHFREIGHHALEVLSKLKGRAENKGKVVELIDENKKDANFFGISTT